MKLSTRKVVGIELGVVLLWLGMALIPSTVWREYARVAVLGIALLVGWWLLGWAKPRAREGQLATMVVTLAALVFQVVWFVFLGLKLGFVHNVYQWNWSGIFSIFLPIGLVIVLEEVLRGQMVARGHESKLVLVGTVLTLVILEMMWFWPVYNLLLAKDIFDLIVVVAVPSLLKGILLTYIAYEYDYRANIIYRLVMEMPVYLLPIIPDVSEYLTIMFSIAFIVVLAIVLVRMHSQAAKVARLHTHERPEAESKVRWKKVIKYGAIGVVTVGLLAYVGLMSGIFKYHLLAIGSGSMEPGIGVGDMVLVEKTDKYDEIEEGEVLVFRHANMVVVHRLIGREEQAGNYYFKTKGDANESADAWEVGQGDVIGVARGRIMAFGYPTLWLNELFNGGKI